MLDVEDRRDSPAAELGDRGSMGPSPWTLVDLSVSGCFVVSRGVAGASGVASTICDTMISSLSFDGSRSLAVGAGRRVAVVSGPGVEGASDSGVVVNSLENSVAEISSRSLEVWRWNLARLRGVEEGGVTSSESSSEPRLRFLPPLLIPGGAGVASSMEAGVVSLLFGFDSA